jgi:haloalkane dehalogenase
MHHPDRDRVNAAWKSLEEWNQPVITIFSDGDPITRGGEKIIQERIPGSREQEHKILKGGHFLPEDAPERIVEEIVRFTETSL